MLARDLRDRFQVDNFEQRIARGLDPNHSRVLFDRRFKARCVGKIDIREIEIRGATPDFFEKSKRSAIKIVADDNMRTAFEQIERGGHGGESGSESKATCATFEIGDAFFVSEPGRINRA